jgi:alpha-1,6-mannosyltransferase
MRIVQLANFYMPTSGGLRTAVDTIGRGYVAAGHERFLIIPGRRHSETDTDLGTVITLPGVPVSGGYRMVTRPANVRAALDRLMPHSVEVSDKATLLVAGDWARDHDAGSVLFSHERLDTWVAARIRVGSLLEPGIRWWNRRLVNRFDAVVVTSAFAQDEFAQLGVGDVVRIPLGVDLDTFRPAAVLPDNEPARLIYAGRLSKEKNPGAVVEAVELLVRSGIDVRLDVYGDGAVLPGLRRRADGLPVLFHGHVSDRSCLAERLATADVAFAPSPAETFGLSVLEALACGTPVVAANTGGGGELLSPDAGVAVPATPEGLAAGALEVLSRPVLARRAGARRRAQLFPWSATVDSMLNLHKAVVGGDVAPTVQNEVSSS